MYTSYNLCNVEFLIRTSLLCALANRMVLTTCAIVCEACLGVTPFVNWLIEDEYEKEIIIIMHRVS